MSTTTFGQQPNTTTETPTQSLTPVQKYDAYLLTRSNITKQLNQNYQPTKEEDKALKSCEGSITDKLVDIVSLYAGWSAMNGQMNTRKLAIGLGAMSVYLSYNGVRQYNCIMKFNSQPDFPLAIDNRRLLRQQFPTHPILQYVDTGKDMLAPPLQYTNKKPETNQNKQTNTAANTASQSTPQSTQSKYTNSASDIANRTPQSNNNNDIQRHKSIVSERSKPNTPNINNQPLSLSSDTELRFDNTNILAGMTFEDAVPVDTSSTIKGVQAVVDKEMSQTPKLQSDNFQWQPDNQQSQRNSTEQNNKSTERTNSWDKIRNQQYTPKSHKHTDHNEHKRHSTKHTDSDHEHKRTYKELRDLRTTHDNTQVAMDNLYTPDKYHVDYDTSTVQKSELLTMAYQTQEKQADMISKQQKQLERKYKQYRPLANRDGLVIDFTVPAKA